MLEVQQNRRNGRRIWKGIAVIVAVAVAAVAAWLVYQANLAPLGQSPAQVVAPAPDPQPVAVSSNMLFFGNTFWGRYIHDWSQASPLKYAYPFSRLDEFDREKYDAWISGLECPTASDVFMTSAEQEENLQFNCRPEYLPEAAKWFTAFTLANNHTDNQGIEGYEETKTLLDKNGIQYFGHYDPRALDEVCEVVSVPVTVNNDDDSEAKGLLPMAMCGYHGVFRIPLEDSVAQMAKYADYMPVIAMPHMGVEYKPAPDGLKTDFYRSLIDGGADVVLGDHPHWVQSTESYKGRLIVYSMGNFMFDQQDSAEVTRSAAINVLIETKDEDTELLKKWLVVGEQCREFQDDCLQQIKDQRLDKLDVTYKFDAIGTSDAGKIVKPATAAEQASILTRLNWSSTMRQLQAPYSKL